MSFFTRQPSEADQTDRRQRMIKTQLEKRDITDPLVLKALGTVPRHRFVLESDLDIAYGDHPISIGCGQTISQPYIVASMTQHLELNESSRVLEIGTGCGYQTAVLAEICAHVYTIEYIPELSREAEARLKDLGYRNVTAMVGDGSLGWAEYAPFDGIIVTAAAPKIPPTLETQLAANGKMLIPITLSGGSQVLVDARRTSEGLEKKRLYSVRFVPMLGVIDKL
ncbi:MAG: protein-L-isoaspartate(D-aspartate) O-methyltransferase [candidate division Zixibacteria bacterium]|nr:protein-L-isoaspartate(D-aspartate) O-methyltransferase [candidate division Zixibacteria bacterium]